MLPKGGQAATAGFGLLIGRRDCSASEMLWCGERSVLQIQRQPQPAARMSVAPDFARVMAGDQPNRSEAHHDEADNKSHDIDPPRHYEIAPVPVTPMPTHLEATTPSSNGSSALSA